MVFWGHPSQLASYRSIHRDTRTTPGPRSRYRPGSRAQPPASVGPAPRGTELVVSRAAIFESRLSLKREVTKSPCGPSSQQAEPERPPPLRYPALGPSAYGPPHGDQAPASPDPDPGTFCTTILARSSRWFYVEGESASPLVAWARPGKAGQSPIQPVVSALQAAGAQRPGQVVQAVDGVLGVQQLGAPATPRHATSARPEGHFVLLLTRNAPGAHIAGMTEARETFGPRHR
ncbi:hypothetical protein V6Z77_010226 [Aspergillus fumigatus]